MNTGICSKTLLMALLDYPEFAARVRRCKNSVDEDSDFGDIEPDLDPNDGPWDDEEW
jgi:hypothetical protein